MSDDTAHYMESTSRLREQVRMANEKADRFLVQRDDAEATMREVAEELRAMAFEESWRKLERLADRLDPPLVVEKPLHAYFPSDVDAGSRSPCVHCGQAYDAHVPPPVVENPPA